MPHRIQAVIKTSFISNQSLSQWIRESLEFAGNLACYVPHEHRAGVNMDYAKSNEDTQY